MQKRSLDGTNQCCVSKSQKLFVGMSYARATLPTYLQIIDDQHRCFFTSKINLQVSVILFLCK